MNFFISLIGPIWDWDLVFNYYYLIGLYLLLKLFIALIRFRFTTLTLGDIF